MPLRRKKTNILPSISSWVLGMKRAVRFNLSHQWKLARNRPSDTELGHRWQCQQGRAPVRRQQLPPHHPQQQCCGRRGAGLCVWGLLCLWGLTLLSPPSATMAAVTGQLAVLSSHPKKTHPDSWSSPARRAPVDSRRKEPERKIHHSALLPPLELSSLWRVTTMPTSPQCPAQRGEISRCLQ